MINIILILIAFIVMTISYIGYVLYTIKKEVDETSLIYGDLNHQIIDLDERLEKMEQKMEKGETNEIEWFNRKALKDI